MQTRPITLYMYIFEAISRDTHISMTISPLPIASVLEFTVLDGLRIYFVWRKYTQFFSNLSPSFHFVFIRLCGRFENITKEAHGGTRFTRNHRKLKSGHCFRVPSFSVALFYISLVVKGQSRLNGVCSSTILRQFYRFILSGERRGTFFLCGHLRYHFFPYHVDRTFKRYLQTRFFLRAHFYFYYYYFLLSLLLFRICDSIF